jgi:hypothetical protein
VLPPPSAHAGADRAFLSHGTCGKCFGSYTPRARARARARVTVVRWAPLRCWMGIVIREALLGWTRFWAA